ncbi:MAG: hypothetical protein ACREXR_22795, partial [Gammaproteobacteria bacterium]
MRKQGVLRIPAWPTATTGKGAPLNLIILSPAAHKGAWDKFNNMLKKETNHGHKNIDSRIIDGF